MNSLAFRSNLITRSNWWLSAVASSTNFANVNNNGNANNNNASNSNAVRPISCVRPKCRLQAETELLSTGKEDLTARSLTLWQIREAMPSVSTDTAKNASHLFTPFDRMTDLNALYDAFRKAKSGSDWKCSVQKYECHLLENLVKTRHELLTHTYRQKPFVEFILNERGKHRRIKAVHISDRIVQRSLCDNVLVPELERFFIYDNGASVKKKGISFARKRLKVHLSRFIRRKGYIDPEGYILSIDFSKFFDNIPHEKLLSAILGKIHDPDVAWLLRHLVESCAVDLSFLSEEEFLSYKNRPYNALDHVFVPRELLTGEKILHRLLGIGLQISQIAGVYYPTPIDNYCKIVRGCSYYGRYMDDIYIIHEDKEFLKSVLAGIREVANRLGLFINDKKTQITPIHHGFTFLQIKYNVLASGRILTRVAPKKTARERRKLKKYRKFLTQKKMNRRDIANAYQSWRGNALQFDCKKSVSALDKLYNHLFVDN